MATKIGCHVGEGPDDLGRERGYAEGGRGKEVPDEGHFLVVVELWDAVRRKPDGDLLRRRDGPGAERNQDHRLGQGQEDEQAGGVSENGDHGPMVTR